MPSPEHEAMVNLLLERDVTAAPTLDEQRANYEAMLAGMPIADDVTVEPIRIEHVDADWVSVPSSRSDVAILYLHGGGYVLGSNVAYREFGGRLARATRARVCLLNYRLAPEHPFPAAVEDAVMAYQWLRSERYDPARLVIAGDSAGGGLTFATLLALKGAGDPLPACAITLSPWVDLEGTGESSQPGAVDDPLVAGDVIGGMAAAYAPSDLRNPLASPLYGDLSGLPPVQVHVGSREVLLDDSRRICAKAREAGVDAELLEEEGLIHVWPVLVPAAPESAAALDKAARFIDRAL
jgi:monoterpene epsilon-lactone hydrolase